MQTELCERVSVKLLEDGCAFIAHEDGSAITLTEEGAFLLAVLVLGNASRRELQKQLRAFRVLPPF